MPNYDVKADLAAKARRRKITIIGMIAVGCFFVYIAMNGGCAPI